MTTPRESHYDALGVPAGARQGDIKRAHDRLVAEFGRDTTPPDPRREARIREAYETLSDEARREAYDQLLAAAPPVVDRRRAGMVAGVALAAVAAGAWFFLRQDEPAAAGRTAMEIQAEVVRSVGRVQSIDLSGNATPTGIAFTVAKGVMATTCEGLAPGAQVVVTLGTRRVPARVAMADESLGLCALAVDGAGSWPLPVGGAEPRAGDKVYAAEVGATGDVVLAEGTVTQVVPRAPGRLVEASVPAAGAIGGRPLLDVHGRVVGVATAAQPGGAARHVVVPPGWGAEPAATATAPSPTVPSPAVPAPAAPDESAPPAPPADPIQRRAQEIAKKLRPPPNVPEDL